jgi:hypothetical protein
MCSTISANPFSGRGLYAVARNERARNAPLRGTFKLYALQRCGPCISHQRTYDAAKHQHYRGLESDCSRQWRLPRIFARSRRTSAKPSGLHGRGACGPTAKVTRLTRADTSGPKPADLKTKPINTSFIVVVRLRFKCSVHDCRASARDFVANSAATCLALNRNDQYGDRASGALCR